MAVSAFCFSVAHALAPINVNRFNKQLDSRRPYSASLQEHHGLPTLDRNLLQQQAQPLSLEGQNEQQQQADQRQAKEHEKQQTQAKHKRRKEGQQQRQRSLYEVDDIRLIRGSRTVYDLENALQSISSRFWTPPTTEFKTIKSMDPGLNIGIHIGSQPLSLQVPMNHLFGPGDEFQFISTRLCAAALRSLAHIQIKSLSQHPPEPCHALRSDLIHTLEERLFTNAPKADLHALSDVLDALDIFVTKDSFMRYKLKPLARRVVHLVLRDHTEFDLGKMAPAKLSHFLQGTANLKLDDEESTEFVRVTSKIIATPGMIARVSPEYLSHALESVTSVVSNSKMGKEMFEDFLPTFLKAVTNRFRKKQFCSTAPTDALVRSVSAVSNLVGTVFQKEMEPYACTFGYTVIQMILNVHYNEEDTSRRRELTLPMITQLIESWSKLERLPSSRENTVIADLFRILNDEPEIWESSSAGDLEDLLSLMVELDITDQPDVFRLAGERFRMIVMIGSGRSLRPKKVSDILRYPALMHRNVSNQTLRTYLDSAQTLFRDEEFLQRCEIHVLDNFLWILSAIPKEHRPGCDELVKIIITNILDRKQEISSCSSRVASRVLCHATKFICAQDISNAENDEDYAAAVEMRVLLHELFYMFGRRLVSSRSLTPVEVSSAIYAYARASYTSDMEIFHHLVSLLNEEHEQFTSRQLSQCLWACGKMNQWATAEERTTIILQSEPELDGVSQSEYFEVASDIAVTLSKRVGEMNAQDLAQTIWALGRLEICDSEVLSSLVRRVMAHAAALNSTEAASILWGLSKLKYYDPDLMAPLSNRIMELAPTMTSNDAGNILYSMGSLTFRHTELFSVLTERVRVQIDDAGAQDIAHVLLAHRIAKMPAPEQLLDDWASKRLGLDVVAVSSDERRWQDSEQWDVEWD